MTKKLKGLSVRKDGVYVLSKTIDGQRHRFLSKDPAECYRKYNEWLDGNTRGAPFREIADQYERMKYDDIRHGTLKSYAPALRSAVQWFGDRRIKEITPYEVKQYLQSLGNTYAYKTVKNYKGQLSAVFRFAITTLGVQMYNPCDNVQVPRGLARSTRSDITDEQKRSITDYKQGEFILALLILYTGCRCGEACALTWSDIDFDNRTVTINKQLTWVNNRPTISPQKTPQSARVVPLLKPLEVALKMQNRVGFVVSGDNPITYRQLRNRWLSWCVSKGLYTTTTATRRIDGEYKTVTLKQPTIDRHQLRHAYAGILYDCGVDSFAAMHLLGHSDIQTTLNIYTHWHDKNVVKVGEQLNAALSAQNVPK